MKVKSETVGCMSRFIALAIVVFGVLLVVLSLVRVAWHDSLGSLLALGWSKFQSYFNH